jgi:hypothetical protein
MAAMTKTQPFMPFGFQGGIRLVIPLAGERERAGVFSLLYIVSYLGLGVPAVIGAVGCESPR